MWGLVSHSRPFYTSPCFPFCTLWPLLAAFSILVPALCRSLVRTYIHRCAKCANDLWPTSVVPELSPPVHRPSRASSHSFAQSRSRLPFFGLLEPCAVACCFPGDALRPRTRPPPPVTVHSLHRYDPIFLASHRLVSSIPAALTPQVLNVNLKSVWLLSQSAGQHMVPRRRGKIINFCSLLTFQVSTAQLGLSVAVVVSLPCATPSPTAVPLLLSLSPSPPFTTCADATPFVLPLPCFATCTATGRVDCTRVCGGEGRARAAHEGPQQRMEQGERPGQRDRPRVHRYRHVSSVSSHPLSRRLTSAVCGLRFAVFYPYAARCDVGCVDADANVGARFSLFPFAFRRLRAHGTGSGSL